MSNQKIVTESALSAIASDIKGAIQNIPRPMKFKGTLGVGGTITSLPAASSSNEGDTYTVITAGTYRGLVCVVGDNVSSTGTTWVKNPTASSLRGLNDTAINNPHDGQLLTFDGGSNKWVNGVMTATASGSIATFSNGGDDIPVSEFECEIGAQQASGTPTPTSPLPITGHSQADISVCGINLWNEDWENADFDAQGNRRTGTYVCSKTPIKIKPNTSYYFYSGNANGQVYLYYYDSNMNYLIGDTFAPNKTFTTPNNAVYVNFLRGGAYGTTYGNDISINYPSTDTQYHAYNANLYTVSFGQTIYGGRLIYNGQWAIEVTHGYICLYDYSWQYNSGFDVFETGEIHGKNYPSEFICTDYECSMVSSVGSIPNNSGLLRPISMYIKNTDYTDATQFKNSLTNTYMVYELATPTIIPITSSTRVKTISGDNNIYSNTGDCELKYFTNKADSLAELIKAFVV